MITLYCGGPAFGLPESSPYVTKTEVQLKMAGIPYRKERAIPPQSPKGQLPFIDDDGARIGDSTFIRAHLETKYGINLDGLADPAAACRGLGDRADGREPFQPGLGARALDDPGEFRQGPGPFLR